jgi:hypothetical protein
MLQYKTVWLLPGILLLSHIGLYLKNNSLRSACTQYAVATRYPIWKWDQITNEKTMKVTSTHKKKDAAPDAYDALTCTQLLAFER